MPRRLAIALLAVGLALFVAHIAQRAEEGVSGVDGGSAGATKTPGNATATDAVNGEVAGPGSTSGAGSSAAAGGLAYASNQECRGCHQEIWDEWSGDQHAQAWFNGPTFPQDPKRTECTACHAPVPILENGLANEIRVREARHAEGIGCIACHKDGDSSRGNLASADAPCNPTHDARFAGSETCRPCHAPHGSFEEWEASAHRDTSCQACHMPLVERPSATGGAPRQVRSHRFRSARDPEFLRSAVTTEAAVERGDVVVRITNDATGHAFPGEISNRQVLLEVDFFGPDDEQVGREKRVMATPPRPQRPHKPTTQIQSGETREYRFTPPIEWAYAHARLRYQLLRVWPAATTFWEAKLLAGSPEDPKDE